MVQLTEVNSATDINQQSLVIMEDDGDEQFEDDNNIASLDDFNSDETYFERVQALVDIVPPQIRARVSTGIEKGVGNTIGFLKSIGSGVWILATAGMILIMPVALEIEREQFVFQQENEKFVQQQQLQQVMIFNQGGRIHRKGMNKVLI